MQDIIIKTKIELNDSNSKFVVDVNSNKVNNTKEIELIFKVPSNNNEDKELIIDNQLSLTSINPVQNKVITEELNKKGTYSKPKDGIPKNDLSTDIQTSLNNINENNINNWNNKISGDGTIIKIVKVSSLPSSPDGNTLYIIV